MRIQATEQQIQALRTVAAHALSRRQEERITARRQIEHFTRQCVLETEEDGKAHAQSMLAGWRDQLRWIEEKVAEASTAVDFLNRADIVTHKE